MAFFSTDRARSKFLLPTFCPIMEEAAKPMATAGIWQTWLIFPATATPEAALTPREFVSADTIRKPPETTKLCIHGIRKFMNPGDRVLDVGTGSGILGIIALKLGAASAFGTDIDELAVSQAKENIVLNGIDPEDFPVIAGNIIDDPAVQERAGLESYDFVLANILADIIIPLQNVVWAQMKIGAVLNVSGIINLKEEAVRNALLENPHYELLDTEYQGEWVSFTVRRVR